MEKIMKLYLAPLEGITGHIYRNALERYFPGADRYFTPFIAPDQNRILRSKELRDVSPANNRVKELVPQILTNHPGYFQRTVQALAEMGYEEVNLNLGCPSGTVVSRRRGSGMLAYLDELERFLDQIFKENPGIRISVKTRIGRDDAEDAFELMELYRNYPLSELIIHPRTQKDFYRGALRMELFCELLKVFRQQGTAGTRISLCYNGNILTEADYRKFAEQFPQVDAVMLGRGVIANPGLLRQIRTGQPVDKETLQAFLEEVANGYCEIFGEERNALYRMKEIWIYMIHLFADAEKYAKKLRKAQSLAEYRVIVRNLLDDCSLQPEGPGQWNLPQR